MGLALIFLIMQMISYSVYKVLTNKYIYKNTFSWYEMFIVWQSFSSPNGLSFFRVQ